MKNRIDYNRILDIFISSDKINGRRFISSDFFFNQIKTIFISEDDHTINEIIEEMLFLDLIKFVENEYEQLVELTNEGAKQLRYHRDMNIDSELINEFIQ